MKSKYGLLVITVLILLMSGCATDGIRVLLPAQTNFSRYKIAGIIVTNNSYRNDYGATYGYDKTGIIMMDEKQKIRKMTALRLLNQNRFANVYDYEKTTKGIQLILDITINEFGYDQQRNFYATGAIGWSIVGNTWGVENVGILDMNVKLYDATKHSKIAEVDIVEHVKQYLPDTDSSGQKIKYGKSDDYIINCAVDELMTFIDLNM